MMILSTALVACGSDDDDDAAEKEELPTVDCQAKAAPAFADVKAFRLCTNCHSTTITGATRVAPANINFDDYASAAANAHESAEEVKEGKMPPPGSPSPTEEEKEELYRWALCGTPQ